MGELSSLQCDFFVIAFMFPLSSYAILAVGYFTKDEWMEGMRNLKYGIIFFFRPVGPVSLSFTTAKLANNLVV